MKLVFGDLWSYSADWRGITTNGTVNAQGLNIMGSGCAKELVDRYPLARQVVGDLLQKHGNTVQMIHGWGVFTFPTKHHWNDNSDLELIVESSKKLARLAEFKPEDIFVLPRPGVGAGRLNWEVVMPAIENILPDNVHVITWK